MTLRHGLVALALLALAALTAACPIAIEEDELAATPVASPASPLTPPAPAEVPSPVAEATEDLSACGDVTPEAQPSDGQARLEAPTAVARPPRYDPIPFVVDAELESRLAAVLAEADERDGEEEGGTYSIVVKNLGDGSGARINAEHEYYAASLFKVAVMYEAFHQRSQGLLSFDEEMLVTPYYAGFDLGTRAFPVCSTITVEQALAAMMSVSDNASAVMLQDKLGARYVNESMEALGLTTTRLLEDNLPATAADMALLMEMIAVGEAVDEGPSQEMAGLLASEEVDNGLRAGVGEETLVAHKTGNWLNATHDAGIVYSPAATYVIAVLSDKGFEEDADVVITELSRLAWEYYNAPPGE